jgi:D-amino peptidase
MMKWMKLSPALLLVTSTLLAQADSELKVFISVDMEGISGVVVSSECSRSGKDFGLFRKIMTEDTNAAIEGAAAAGATEIIVRDSHGVKRNILPDLLDPRAKLLRGVSGATKNMMDTIDESYDAVIFIGYHAKAGTPDAIIEHTSSGNVTDLSINGVSLPEAGYNALIAGSYDVPVVFVSGDQAICQQVTELFGTVETVAVKEAIGGAALCLHPKVAGEKIKAGVQQALGNLEQYKPYKMSAPYTMVLKMKREEKVYDGALYPGAKRTGDWEITYTSDNLLDVIQAFNKIR